MAELKIFTFNDLDSHLRLFVNSYQLEGVVIPPDSTIRNIAKRQFRVCRFCKRKMPHTTFKKEAHIIPELLGNRYLISDFECDNCNALFNKYENDLANWLGLIRTIIGTQGKNKIPNYRSAKNEIKTETVNIFGKKLIQFSKNNSNEKAINIDSSTGKTTLKYTKQPYIPIRVYKAMLKIALSIIPENDVIDYNAAIQFLINQEKNTLFDDFARMMYHELPLVEFCVNKPIGLLFRKKDNNSKIPKHFFILRYANHMYCFPLPFNQKDIKNDCYKGQNGNPLSIRVIYPPPLLFEKPSINLQSISYNRDFNSYLVVDNDEEVYNLEVAEEALNNLVSYDQTTGELKPQISLPPNIASILFGNEIIDIPSKK